jgi:hypothetical protein
METQVTEARQPPSGTTRPPTLAVALDALESDAVRWTDAAAALRAAAAAAAGLALETGAFSFAGGQVAAMYEALRNRIVALLHDGADNYETVAAALRATAAAYATQDAAQARRLDAVDGRGPR